MSKVLQGLESEGREEQLQSEPSNSSAKFNLRGGMYLQHENDRQMNAQVQKRPNLHRTLNGHCKKNSIFVLIICY